MSSIVKQKIWKKQRILFTTDYPNLAIEEYHCEFWSDSENAIWKIDIVLKFVLEVCFPYYYYYYYADVAVCNQIFTDINTDDKL